MTTDPETPLRPADYPHEPDPAHPTTTAHDGAPGTQRSTWAVCLHCRQRYPVDGAGVCQVRWHPAMTERLRRLGLP